MTPDVPTLEDRARRAAAGVKEAVDTADLQLFAAGIPALRTPETSPRGFRGFDRWIAAAGAFAAILIVVGLALLPGRLFAPDNDTATPQTTLPDSTVSSVVPDPDGEETVVTDAEPETTTSTTEAAETPTTIAVDTMPPELAITSPSDGATVTKGTIQFRGTTEPGARVIAAGQWEADVDAEGNWEISLGVSSGSNIATFTAIDEAGNETTAQVTVSYDPPSPTTTTSTTLPEEEPGDGEGAAIEFTVMAQFETCEESPPFNVYWGTAPAGHKVAIGSEYGEGSVFADETGNWELRVEFPEAPYGEEFLVTARHLESGEARSFGFTSLADG